jgi:signal transduction histidine kinase
MAVLMSCGGLLWGTIAAYYGMPIPSSVPLGYVVLTALNLWYLSATARFRQVRFLQLLMSLVLPFLFQWSLGGFVPSGAVMLWSMTAVLGALTFQEASTTLRWFLAYLGLTILSGALDANVGQYSRMSSDLGATLFVLNMIGVSFIVFGLMLYFVRSNEIAYAQLAKSRQDLVESQVQLVQAEKMASIGSLTAGLAHEMNTPVGVINSNADVSARCIAAISKALAEIELASAQDGLSSVRRSLGILQSGNAATLESSARITGLVENLRRFTRLDEASRQDVDLHEGIESALYLMQHDLRGRVVVTKEFGNIPKVTCQASDLNQVFMHLLRNAAEAIPGTGTVTIRSYVDAGKVHVCVIDSGVGMSPEQVRRAFDPRIKRSGSRARAGLGLFICYGIVTQHNGQIEIDSRLGEGTTVTVSLPVA